MTAAVWGKMWRYCQGKDGVCRAKLERIAKELNISRMTVIRHIETLVADGFMKDTTPDLKNRPHVYADTGKVAMFNKFGMSVTVTESYSAVTESDSESHTELLEDSIEDSKQKRDSAPNFKTMELKDAKRLDTLRMYEQATNFFPGSLLWETVHNAITDNNLTFEQINEAAIAWELNGYRRENVKGILDWAKNGVPENKREQTQTTTFEEELEKAGYV